MDVCSAQKKTYVLKKIYKKKRYGQFTPPLRRRYTPSEKYVLPSDGDRCFFRTPADLKAVNSAVEAESAGAPSARRTSSVESTSHYAWIVCEVAAYIAQKIIMIFFF